mgnify:CR=1 FL=1
MGDLHLNALLGPVFIEGGPLLSQLFPPLQIGLLFMVLLSILFPLCSAVAAARHAMVVVERGL